MKANITVTKNEESLSFYLISEIGKFFLFTHSFSDAVFRYFRRGRSEREVRSFKGWNQDKKLDKVIEMLPLYMAYARREAA